MQNYYRLEERAPQAGSIGDTQKSAQRHPSIFSTDAPLLPKLGFSPLPRIVRAKPAIDGKNPPKQLAEFFADRHANVFRFVPRFGRWVFWNGERWCLDDFGHYRAAAQQLCHEAAARMRDPNVGSTGMAAAVLRLASFSPRMTAPIDGDTEPLLESLLGKKGVRNG
jgi:hypothetical protein